MLTGENGILTQANKAKVETRGAAVQEVRDLWKNNQRLDKETGTSTAQSLEGLVADLEREGLLINGEPEQVLTTGKVTIGSRTIIFDSEINENPPEELGQDTLVEMFKKAQKEGCTNEDGSCTDETHIHIGDYVDYKNPTEGTYTVLAKNSGMENAQKKYGFVDTDQTFDVKNNQLNWRVLGLDEETGGIKLIAGSPMKQNDVDSSPNRGPYLYFYGASPCVNGVNELTNLGALYKNDEYAEKARSINIEDVNQVLGIKESEITKYNFLATSGATQYQEEYGPYENQWLPSAWLAQEPATTVSGTAGAYMYIIGDEEGSFNVKEGRVKNMLFNNTETGTGKAYWLANSEDTSFPSQNMASFGVGFAGGQLQGQLLTVSNYNSLYTSDGSEVLTSMAVRPVVILKDTVTKEQVGKLKDKEEESWNYSLVNFN